jgi:hypothetical protein
LPENQPGEQANFSALFNCSRAQSMRVSKSFLLLIFIFQLTAAPV